MPLTEAPPPQPPGTEEQTPRARRRAGRRNRGDYEGLEGYDLLHVIDELEDERARVALREKIWIALILHFLLFAYLIFAPKYIWHVKVRDASQMRDKDKKMTFLDLPPDALKQLKPKTPEHISDKDRRQQAPKPVPTAKPAQQLPPAPPAPRPAPQQPKTPPAPAPPQVAQQQPAPQPKPAPKPAPPAQTADVEAPKPQPTKPNFSNNASTARDAVQEAARQARSGSPSYGGGDAGTGAPSRHPGETGPVDILSDTLGVDFGPYIQRVIYATKRAWYPIIPEVAQPPISKQGKVLIRFKILPDGSVTEMKLEGPSGTVSLDRAAWAGIVGAAPFPNLPTKFKGPFLELRFYFLYNEDPGIH